jgi:hypothetical protein
MITITTSKGKFIIVPIIKDVCNKEIYIDNNLLIVNNSKCTREYRIQLPAVYEEWSYICTTDTITEEIASKICERDKWGFIKDYTDNFETCISYYDSFRTLLQSHNLDNNKTYAICKKN